MNSSSMAKTRFSNANRREGNPSASERGTILLVESEQAVGNLLTLLLQRHGYQVLCARTAAEAMRIWKSSSAGIDLLLTNTDLPGAVKGQSLSRQLQVEKPELKVVYTSNARPKAPEKTHLIEGVNYIQNPCHPDSFVRLIHACFSHAQRN